MVTTKMEDNNQYDNDTKAQLHIHVLSWPLGQISQKEVTADEEKSTQQEESLHNTYLNHVFEKLCQFL